MYYSSGAPDLSSLPVFNKVRVAQYLTRFLYNMLLTIVRVFVLFILGLSYGF